MTYKTEEKRPPWTTHVCYEDMIFNPVPRGKTRFTIATHIVWQRLSFTLLLMKVLRFITLYPATSLSGTETVLIITHYLTKRRTRSPLHVP